MYFTKQQVRALRRDNEDWPPSLKPVPREHWPQDGETKRIEVWRSRNFLVQVFIEAGATRLSVNRTDWDIDAQRWKENISWDDLQRLKAETGRGDLWAVEIFPADWETVNVANMRHLWVLSEAPPFGWKRARVESAPAPRPAGER